MGYKTFPNIVGDCESSSKPRHSKKDHRKTAQENELELEVAEQVSATVAATDMTACMTDFGCFGGI